MARTLGSELYIRSVEGKTRGQRGFSAHVLGLHVISLAMLAVPVSPPAGEPSAFWTSRVGIPASATRVDDAANGAWSLAEAEYYAAKYGVDLLASTSRSEALARSHRGQPVDDPANGAWSLAEAEYYIVKYRAEGINTVTLVNDVRKLFGDAGSNLNRP